MVYHPEINAVFSKLYFRITKQNWGKTKETHIKLLTTIILHTNVKKCPSRFISLIYYISYIFSEHDYIKALNAYDKEVEELKQRLKKNPHWVD